MAKREKTRFYSFKIVSYATREEIQPLLDSAKHWVCILHDRDEADNHYHVLATFHRELSFAQVRALVVSDQNTLVNPLNDWVGDYEYLTHKNAPEKAQYDVADLESDSFVFWARKANVGMPDDDKNREFVDDLLNGRLSYREMAYKYGRDYIRNFHAYDYFKTAVEFQEGRQPEERL